MPSVTATVNGRQETFEAAPMESLLSVLRERLFLTGAKGGCHEGVCGACTVIVDDVPVNACLFTAQAAQGRSIETVEGLKDAVGRAVQQNMVAAGGVQCGYCTSGFVVMLTALLRSDPNCDEATIRRALAGNLCRCTGYAQIFDAADGAKRQIAGGRLENV